MGGRPFLRKEEGRPLQPLRGPTPAGNRGTPPRGVDVKPLPDRGPDPVPGAPEAPPARGRGSPSQGSGRSGIRDPGTRSPGPHLGPPDPSGALLGLWGLPPAPWEGLM